VVPSFRQLYVHDCSTLSSHRETLDPAVSVGSQMLENVEGYAGNEVGEFIQVVGKTVLDKALGFLGNILEPANHV
jgi:hypothetical protein